MRLNPPPRADEFYHFFSEAARNLVSGADILTELSLRDADHQGISDRLRALEHANDDVTHRMLRALNSTSETPFDREDVYRLGSTLDDVMDHMEAAGNLVYLYGLSSLPALPREMHELVEVLVSSARVTIDAMDRLKSMKDLERYWIEANELENSGDHSYRMLLVRLFSGEYDALTVMKLKEVADELEAAADAFENVANTVETIVVKGS